MFNNKKAAIQLSMSFLVMLIMAIVIFILSLAFLGNFFDQSVKLKTSLDQQTKGQIERMLAGNERVAISLETKTIKRGDVTQFGIGIRNTLAKEYFRIELSQNGKFIPIENPEESYAMSCSERLDFEEPINICTIGGSTNGGLRYEGQSYSSDVIQNNIQYALGRQGKLKIEMNKEDIVPIAIQTGRTVPRGHYIFNVYVCSDEDSSDVPCTLGGSDDNIYGDGVQKIHLIVK